MAHILVRVSMGIIIISTSLHFVQAKSVSFHKSIVVIHYLHLDDSIIKMIEANDADELEESSKFIRRIRRQDQYQVFCNEFTVCQLAFQICGYIRYHLFTFFSILFSLSTFS